MSDISDRILQLLTQKGISYGALSEMTHIPKSALQRYATGETQKIPVDRLKIIAKALNISAAYLMGWETETPKDNFDVFSLPDVQPMPTMKKVPHVGSIACGLPILAVENIDGYSEIPEHIHADFSLTCKGDSMIDACIRDGDHVFIRIQPDVEDGEIAAVLIGEETTLKRVYKIGSDRLELRAENRAYPPMTFSGEELNNIRIMGKAVYFTSMVR